MPAPSRSKYYCFTLNNYNDDDCQRIKNLFLQGEATYVIIGHEIGAETNTRHLQGYVEFFKRIRLSQVKRLVSSRAHFEARRGTSDQASDYCKKDGNFEEHGTLSESQAGKRNDLLKLKEDIDNGSTLLNISDDHFGSFLRYERSIKSYYLLHGGNNKPLPSVVVYYGATGTGKTRSVWDNAKDHSDIWVYPGNGWFDGYIGQPIALFDDFYGSEIKISLLLKILDRYPLRVPIKGGFTWWVPEEIYITSNVDPGNWFPNANFEHVNALMRRFTNKVHFN